MLRRLELPYHPDIVSELYLFSPQPGWCSSGNPHFWIGFGLPRQVGPGLADRGGRPVDKGRSREAASLRSRTHRSP